MNASRNVVMVLVLLGAGLGMGHATVVSVVNASFETLPNNPVLLTNGCPGSGGCWYTQNQGIPGWAFTGVGNFGQNHPNIQLANIFEVTGVYVAYTGLFGPGYLTQALSETLQAGGTYTLEVDVARRFDLPTIFGNYVVQILAGNTVIANGTIVNPANGQFLTSTATYTSPSGDPLAGQTLSIRLGTSTSGNQNLFDNVRFDANVVPTSVPEPSSLMLLGSGLAGFAGVIRRKLNR